jgi:membrane dipeptidase
VKKSSFAFAVLWLFAFRATAAEDLKARAARIHRSAIVIDTHEDVPYRLEKEWVDIRERQKTGHVDIPRLRQGGVTGAFFADYVPAEFAERGGSAKKALELAELIHRIVAAHPADLVFADSPAGVRAAKKAGKIAVLIGIEGGHAIENSLGALAAFHRLGVRYMTLTHTNSNGWADSSGSFFRQDFNPKKFVVHGGLNDLGRDVVLEMNRLGMLVDVSHVSDDTIRDVLAASKAPVFASHSSCRAICDAPRNMTDDMIKALAAKGGVIQINYHVGFLSQEFRDAEKAHPEEEKAIQAELKKRCGENEACHMIEGDRIVREYVAQGKLPRISWEKIVEHIDHAVKIAGVQHVGLGSDFDGADMPFGMEDSSKLPQITEALLRKGYSEGDVRKILGENTLRVMTEVERVSREINAEKK